MAINFLNLRASLEEKTLTPAEMKKREEVAKAIKREHPNMPMGMKMAIATKTAKRVAEETEQLDEITAEKAMKQHHAWVKGMEGQTSDTISKKLEQAKQKETAHHNEVKKRLDSGEMKHGSQEHKAMVNTWNRLSRNTKDLESKHSWLKEKEAKAKRVNENNIVGVIDGVRSDRKYNDADHAHNSLSKLVSYGKAKKAELYVNGEKTKHYELNKKYNDFAPKKLSEEIEHVEEAALDKNKPSRLKVAIDRYTEKAIAANKAGDHDAVKAHQSKINAIKNQMAKLASEEVEQVAEVSKNTLRSYVSKASDDYGHSEFASRAARKPAEKSIWAKRALNRAKGLERAIPRIVGEEEHYCAKHVYSELFGEGQVIEADHAEPDENGNIEWYNVQFEHGAEKVFTEDIEIMVAEYHANHKRKKRKMMEDDNGQ